MSCLDSFTTSYVVYSVSTNMVSLQKLLSWANFENFLVPLVLLLHEVVVVSCYTNCLLQIQIPLPYCIVSQSPHFITTDVTTFFPTRYRMSPLMYAAREGRVTVCEKLLEHGAEVNKQDMRGWTVSCLQAVQYLESPDFCF